VILLIIQVSDNTVERLHTVTFDVKLMLMQTNLSRHELRVIFRQRSCWSLRRLETRPSLACIRRNQTWSTG
jgi:hypothetical protein